MICIISETESKEARQRDKFRLPVGMLLLKGRPYLYQKERFRLRASVVILQSIEDRRFVDFSSAFSPAIVTLSVLRGH